MYPLVRGMVYRQVLMHRRSTAIRLKYTFSEETVQRLVEEQPSLERDTALTQALDKCLQKLSEDQRELVRLRYFSGETLKQVAARMNRSPDAVYKQIQRIREALQQCISKRLDQEGWT